MLGQDRLAIKKTSGKKWKGAETMYVVLPTPLIPGKKLVHLINKNINKIIRHAD
jgi:hypothetical protein